MKKNIKFVALAIAALALTAACNNNAPEEVIDTTPIDTAIVEEVIDTTPAVEEPVVEEPVKATAKKATKKEEVKADNNDRPVEIKVNKNGVQLRNSENTVNIQTSTKEEKGPKPSISVKSNIGKKPINIKVEE